jgi:hypothetical protein
MTCEVQARLNDVLVNDLGLGNIGRINIIVSRFSRKSCRGGKFLSENSCERPSRVSEGTAGEDS